MSRRFIKGTCVCGFTGNLGEETFFDHVRSCPVAQRRSIELLDAAAASLKSMCEEDSPETELTLP